jgi:hypothetical protein
VHFLREKFRPNGGPDGGNGGRGGHIILRGNKNMWTLLHLRYHKNLIAEDGERGSKNNCTGRDGEDVIIEVPLGTIAKDEETGKYGYWENPNAKWDWYQLGGRWAGFFRLKPGAKGENGRAGLFGKEAEPGHADAVKKCDIDFEWMRADAESGAGDKYDEIISIVGESINEMHSWDKVRDVMFPGDRDLARDFYNSQLAPTKLKEWNSVNSFKFSFIDLEDFQSTREDYVKRVGDAAFSSFAVIKDGVWYQKGEMGWWGMASNTKEQGDWNKEISNLLVDLPDDTLISIYDCHI